MGIVAAIATVAGAAYSAEEQRKAASKQAEAMREQAAQAAQQAAEAARANALAAQTANERERAQATAKANVELASQQQADTPTVELASAAPTEAARRRTVRATFTPDDPSGGTSIRL